jgi:RNA polymerase sigma factor (TIGR02999 family)
MMAALYDDLRRIAHRERWNAGQPATMQTTVVLHESYLKLHHRSDWESREHFLGTVALTMRHVLVDAARARMTAKRGGDAGTLPLDAADAVAAGGVDDQALVRLGEAMRELAELDPLRIELGQLARVVDCRYFAGMSDAETAKLMGVSDRTIRRWWIQARAWIHSEIAAD